LCSSSGCPRPERRIPGPSVTLACRPRRAWLPMARSARRESALRSYPVAAASTISWLQRQSSGARGPPVVAWGLEDHGDGSRRAESLRTLSGCAARRLAPGPWPSSPAAASVREGRSVRSESRDPERNPRDPRPERHVDLNIRLFEIARRRQPQSRARNESCNLPSKRRVLQTELHHIAEPRTHYSCAWRLLMHTTRLPTALFDSAAMELDSLRRAKTYLRLLYRHRRGIITAPRSLILGVETAAHATNLVRVRRALTGLCTVAAGFHWRSYVCGAACDCPPPRRPHRGSGDVASASDEHRRCENRH
jgi:hypothetical protein